MKKRSNISGSIEAALYTLKLRQDGLAVEMGVSQAALSKIMSGDRRPARTTIQALCTALKEKDYAQAVLVLIGHLEDEIEASGMLLSDVEMAPAGRQEPTRIDVEKHIDTIRRGALRSKETALLLRDLAWLIDHADIATTYEEGGTPASKIAEDE